MLIIIASINSSPEYITSKPHNSEDYPKIGKLRHKVKSTGLTQFSKSRNQGDTIWKALNLGSLKFTQYFMD